MRQILILVIIGGVLALGVVLYRSRYSSSHIQVDPHAQEQIEKAKHR